MKEKLKIYEISNSSLIHDDGTFTFCFHHVSWAKIQVTEKVREILGKLGGRLNGNMLGRLLNWKNRMDPRESLYPWDKKGDERIWKEKVMLKCELSEDDIEYLRAGVELLETGGKVNREDYMMDGWPEKIRIRCLIGDLPVLWP